MITQNNAEQLIVFELFEMKHQKMQNKLMGTILSGTIFLTIAIRPCKKNGNI